MTSLCSPTSSSSGTKNEYGYSMLSSYVLGSRSSTSTSRTTTREDSSYASREEDLLSRTVFDGEIIDAAIARLLSKYEKSRCCLRDQNNASKYDRFCWVCWEKEKCDEPLIHCACACKRSVAHISCLIATAEASTVDGYVGGFVECPTCKMRYRDTAKFYLALAFWSKNQNSVRCERRWYVAATYLASAFYHGGEYDAGIALQCEILKHWPEDVGTLTNLTNTLWNRGDRDRVIPLRRKILSLATHTCGCNAPTTLSAAGNLAFNLMETSDQFLKEAEILVRDTIQKRELALGQKYDHPDRLVDQINLGYCLLLNADYLKAAPVLQEASKAAHRVFGVTHPEAARASDLLHALRNMLPSQDSAST